MVNSLIVRDARSARDNSSWLKMRGLRARDNPFRVERLHTFRYRLTGITWDEVLDRLERLQLRGATVGPEGSGKTTFLEDLRDRLHALGRKTRWLQIRRDTRRQARQLVHETLRLASPHEILLVDGAEQIGPITWRWLKRQSRQHAGLIITVHQPGRLPTLLQCPTSSRLLRQMVRELAPEHRDMLEPELPGLFARHGGNVRLCVREMYDWLAIGGPAGL